MVAAANPRLAGRRLSLALIKVDGGLAAEAPAPAAARLAEAYAAHDTHAKKPGH